MKKAIAFLFPGQGSQYAGMGKDFYEQIESSRKAFDLASEVLQLDMKQLCFTENEQLHQTRFTQAAMLTVELAILTAVKEQGIDATVNAGLSLGEYGALLASDVLLPDEALKLVSKRGILMEEAYPTGGAMAAVLGMDGDLIEQICRQTEGIVEVANYNCPGQVVITGAEDAVKRASEQLKEAGARRILPLNVSGPFHSSLLTDAGKKLRAELDQISVRPFKIPYLANVTGDYVKQDDDIRDLLEKQVASSVRWQQSVEKMLADGVDTFIEIGPGKTLTGFMKKIDRKAAVYPISTVEELENVTAVWRGEA